MVTSKESQEPNLQAEGERLQSLGEHFRQAREALNLSLDDVSKQIHLRPSILQRLENNEFTHSSIPSTFIKGYIRNYAKFLRLPEGLWNEVVASVEETTKNDLSKRTKATNAVNEYASHSRWVGWVSILVVILLIAMTALWWWENYQKSNAERDSLVQNYVEAQQNSVQNVPMLKEPQENAIAVPQPIEAEKTSQNNTALLDANNVQPAVATSVNAEENNPVENASQPVVAMPTAQAETAQPATQAPTSAQLLQSEMEKMNTAERGTETSPAENESAVENSAVSLPAADSILSIEVTGASCWIRVRDANRKTLAEKLYKQGEVLNFNQNTAYDLTIGAPNNVKITYKGEAYPLKVDGRVAKFKLQ